MANIFSNIKNRIRGGLEVFTDEEARREATIGIAQSQSSTPVRDFFRPTEEVRFRDVAREVPQATKNVFRDVAQGAARDIASIGATFISPLTGQDEIIVDDRAAFIFGEDEKVKTIQQRVAETELTVQRFGRERDIETIERGALPISFVGVGAMVGLDLFGGGGKDDVVKQIARLDDVGEISKVLRNIRVPEENIVDLAKRLKPIKDTAKVDNILKGVSLVPRPKPSSILDNVKNIFEKPKKADDFVRNNEVGFQIPEDTIGDYLKRQVQDKMQRLEKVQLSIKKSGREISENADAYLQQELFIGRATEKIDGFRSLVIKSEPGATQKSLLERMADDGINLDEIGEYMHAKHAFERNRRVAEINPKIEDGGSGLTNAEARKILESFDDEAINKLERYSNEFREQVLDARLRLLQESGLEKPETVQRLRESYDNYVPLKVEGKESLGGIGKGFSASGSNVQRLKGSTRKDRTNPLVQAIVEYEKTLVKAEKNKVAKVFKNLVEENPNEKLWEIRPLTYNPRFDKNGELVSLDPNFKFADNILEVRENGKISLIEIKDRELANAMKNMGTEKGIQILNNINSYLRGVNTFFNPEFVITNFERDIQTALINIGGEQGGEIAKNVAKDVPRAMKGIWQNVRQGADDTEWSRLYQEMKEAGGRVGWFEQKTVNDRLAELTKLIDSYNARGTKAKLRKTLDATARYVSDTNEVVESAVRLSAYKNAKQAGATKAQAAQIAKNLTVNFNKKGNIGTALNSLYLFANAGVQGTARVLTALKHKTVRRITYGIIAASYGINEMNRAINEEEYDKLSDFQKDTSWVFMMPNGNHLKIRLPYGYNIFKVLGDVIYDQTHGKKTAPENMKRLFIAMDNAFNPLSSGSLPQFLSPTISDPFVQVSENKNFFGGPIRPEQPTFGPQEPESNLFFSTVRKPSKAVAKWINKITGGSDAESGIVDISPEVIDHYIDFIGGGVGKLAANVFNTGVAVEEGELPQFNNMPFIRQFIGEPFPDYEKFKVYELQEKSSTKELTENELKLFRNSIKEGVKKGDFDAEQMKRITTSVMNNQAKIQAQKVFEDLEDSTVEERQQALRGLSPIEREQFKKIVVESFKNTPEEVQEENDEDEIGFFESFTLAMRGLTVDPANVAKAVFTREKLSEVEGNLVELQRDRGEDYFNEDGSLNEKGAFFLKKEMMEEMGLSEDQMPDFRREHIVPVSAGGDNSNDNLQIIPTELHQSYTPLDIAVGKAVREGKITRQQAEGIMRALKVENDITIDEAFDRLRQLSSD